jgi:hypothetical protein
MIETTPVTTKNEILKILREELNEQRKKRQRTGHVAGLDPLIVSTKDGPTHVTAVPHGLELQNGDWVQIERTSAGFIVVGKLAPWSDPGDPTIAAHTHLQADITDPTPSDVEFIERKVGSGQSSLAWTLPTTYDHFKLKGPWSHDAGSGIVTCSFTFNNNSGGNYSVVRFTAEMTTNVMAVSSNDVATNFFTQVGNGVGALDLDIIGARESVVGFLCRYRSKAVTGSDNRFGQHFSMYVNGPVTSLQMALSANGWGSATELDLYGIRGG